MGSWLGRLVVSSAVRKVVYILVGIAMAFLLGTGHSRAAGLEPGPTVRPVLAVPCVGPEDPVGCDPLETPAPTPTPTPAPTPTPEPTPVPTLQTVIALLSAEDRQRVDLVSFTVVFVGGLIVGLLAFGTVLGLRRG